MRILHIDIETYSSVSLPDCGVYAYVQSPDFEILLLSYAVNDRNIKVVDLASGDRIPDEFLYFYNDPDTQKWAHNAIFERNAFKAYGMERPIEEWYCSAIKAAYCGLPLGLDAISKILRLEEKGKLSTGKELIRYFCIPVKPTKSNNYRTRNLPNDAPDKWDLFKKYVKNDVEAEREICNRLKEYKIIPFERLNYIVDQEINDLGIMIDVPFVKKAVSVTNQFSEKCIDEVKRISGIDNPCSAPQLKKWLSSETGKIIKTLSKETLPELLESASGVVKEVLSIRKELSKSSVTKYPAMLNCLCDDGRLHGLFQFYGAGRTGRYAGRLVQLHNLPQNHIGQLDEARNVVANKDCEEIELIYGSVISVLSELIRTAFIAAPGYTFAVADFSAIEARVLSWLAGEKWRMDVFNTHGKIYEASASKMFNIPIEQITKDSPYRKKGKISELALGYQGGLGALKKMGGTQMGLTDKEMREDVKTWRNANPAIVDFWRAVEDVAKYVIKNRTLVKARQFTFRANKDYFIITLPSGRELFYKDPAIGEGSFGDAIFYHSMNQTIHKWELIDTYGGKLTENIVQAVARDLLVIAMQRLRDKGYRIVMHVHDEVIVEVKENRATTALQEIIDLMTMPSFWTQGLPLRAEGYTTPYYKKD